MNIDSGKWWSVSRLTSLIKRTLDLESDLQHVWLRAEISNFKRHSRGHMYFTLKDEKSKISAVMFAGNNRRITFEPENGMKVLIKGNVSVYEPFGQYQLYVNDMEPDGIGQLYIQYEKLKKMLEEEGLFSPERKKSIPSFPTQIAVVTSPTGAAIKDIVSTLKRRFPVASITLFPVLVQGREAPFSITNALKRVDEAGGFDLVITGRGGGSIEELWAFNEESVARMIAKLTIPVISAVGHETDFTIADFVADLRAATPTAAAELAVPMLTELQRQVSQLKTRLYRSLFEKKTREIQRLDRIRRSYAFRYPAQLLRQKEQDLDGLLERLERSMTGKSVRQMDILKSLEQRLQRRHPEKLLIQSREVLSRKNISLQKSMQRCIDNKSWHFRHNLQKLQLLNPLEIMERGYSVARNKDGSIVSSVSQVSQEEEFQLQVKDGTINAEVVYVSENKNYFKKGDGGYEK
ncbi:exodeoxyribonuclease VII large subunit [Alteribacillus sp. HJP-4]|uniref:exodeoxyribonuclease VII large subunit n=1 Tax=Alteribacillus sp. HJP-4 TaxID=2775394 RepID=UPI0035CD2CA5